MWLEQRRKAMLQLHLSAWSTIYLFTKVRLILETWRYIFLFAAVAGFIRSGQANIIINILAHIDNTQSTGHN